MLFRSEVFVVHADDEGAGAGLLAGKARQVRKTRDGDDADVMGFNGFGYISDTEAGRGFRVIVLVNNDDGEVVFH